MSDVAPALPADVPQPSALLGALLDISLTGVLLLRPLYAAAGEAAPIIDFAYVHPNPAAQQMLQFPACPAESFLTLFPKAQAMGVFGFYREAFRSGRVERHQQNYHSDGLDGYYLLVAQRQGPLLVVSFTDTKDQDRSAMERALRASQARERAALAEAEAQQALLYQVFEQAPAMICILQGPEHVFQFANPSYRALVGGQPLVGRPFAEALPELARQGLSSRRWTRSTALANPSTPASSPRGSTTITPACQSWSSATTTWSGRPAATGLGPWTGCWSLPTTSRPRCGPASRCRCSTKS